MSSEADSTHVQLAAAMAEERISLGHRLGQGAMGSVWAGTHDDHGSVVVKLMHAHVDPRNVDRFRLEGQALSRIQSPHVVRVLAWGLWGDRPYLVMERLEGTDLDGLLEGGTVTWPEAVRIAKDLLRGLAVVHHNKIVHRDIKPANAFLCRGDRGAVLLDFGVAKLLERVTGVDPIENATRLGTAVGTPRYIAPEQARGQAIDHRADLYSLGVVLFTMLTGAHLFRAKTISSMLLAHVKEAPRPPSLLAPEVPSALDDVVLRALAKRPDDRFADAEAMLEALEAVEAEHLGRRPQEASASSQPGAGTEIIPMPLFDAEAITRELRSQGLEGSQGGAQGPRPPASGFGGPISGHGRDSVTQPLPRQLPAAAARQSAPIDPTVEDAPAVRTALMDGRALLERASAPAAAMAPVTHAAASRTPAPAHERSARAPLPGWLAVALVALLALAIFAFVLIAVLAVTGRP